ncbi:MAG: lysophospholipid acyltransferase family protein [Salinarimonas sp.]
MRSLSRLTRAVTITTKALLLVLVFFALWPFHIISLRRHGRLARRLPILFHRFACAMIGLTIRESGTRPRDVPALILSNHSSWIDIVALSALAPVSFVAKSEIAGWPVFGTLARLQRSIFVDRNNRRATGEIAQTMARRLGRGEWIVLFAEGTTSDGNRVLPFKAPLVRAARMALDPGRGEAQGEAQGEGESGLLPTLVLQPLAITYTRRNGLPLTRRERPELCWYGTMDLVPHLADILAGGPIDVVIHWGTPLSFDAASDRKALTRQAWREVREAVSRANRGRDLAGGNVREDECSRADHRRTADSR